MDVKIQLILAVFISHGLVLAVALAVPVSSTGVVDADPKPIHGNDSNRPLSLRYLGLVEGKAFFVEANLTMNWTDAKAYCAAHDLQLASIRTQNELTFLNRTLYGTGFHWTSARETRTLSMVRWDEINVQPEASMFLTGYSAPVFQICGAFEAHSRAHVDLYLFSCSTSFRIICQGT